MSFAGIVRYWNHQEWMHRKSMFGSTCAIHVRSHTEYRMIFQHQVLGIGFFDLEWRRVQWRLQEAVGEP